MPGKQKMITTCHNQKSQNLNPGNNVRRAFKETVTKLVKQLYKTVEDLPITIVTAPGESAILPAILQEMHALRDNLQK